MYVCDDAIHVLTAACMLYVFVCCFCADSMMMMVVMMMTMAAVSAAAATTRHAFSRGWLCPPKTPPRRSSCTLLPWNEACIDAHTGIYILLVRGVEIHLLYATTAQQTVPQHDARYIQQYTVVHDCCCCCCFCADSMMPMVV